MKLVGYISWFIVFMVLKYANSIVQRGQSQIKHTHTHTHTHTLLHMRQAQTSFMLRHWVCSFHNSSCFLSKMGFFTNQDVIIATKIRVFAPLQLLLSSTGTCSSSLYDFGNHLFKCKIGGEWHHQNSVLVHLMASICTSVQLPVQH